MRTATYVFAIALSLVFANAAAAQPTLPDNDVGPGPGDVVPPPADIPDAPGDAPLAPGDPPLAPGPLTPGLAPQVGDAPQPQLTREQQLDRLFAALKVAPSPDAAKGVERRITAIWTKSGSDTVDLLTRWADDAIDAKNFPLALDYLDRITSLKPDYVEGWDKRASVFFQMEEYGKALADIERVLTLEPRHFPAIAGLGSIMRALGEDQKAAAAYKRALELDPNLESVRESLDRLGVVDSDI